MIQVINLFVNRLLIELLDILFLSTHSGNMDENSTKRS